MFSSMVSSRHLPPRGTLHSQHLHHQLASKSLLQRMAREATLVGHTGCVNTVAWNEKGTCLITGSDDGYVKIWDPFSGNLSPVRSINTGHEANIFSAKFMTNTGDQRVVSCDAAGVIRLTDLEKGTKDVFNCNSGVTFDVVPDPDNRHIFFSCGEDGTVRMYDTRLKMSCRCNFCEENVVVSLGPPGKRVGIAAMCFNPLDPAIFSLGCWDSSIRTFDRRMTRIDEGVYKMCPSFLQRRRVQPGLSVMQGDTVFKVTSLCYNYNGTELLVSYSNEHIYCIRPNAPPDLSRFTPSEPTTYRTPRVRLRGDWADTGPESGSDEQEETNPLIRRIVAHFQRYVDIQAREAMAEEANTTTCDTSADKDVIQCYKGHRNSRTMIKEANFYGSRSEFVLSGSDDGRIFIWDSKTAEVVNYLVGDKHVVNCVQPHPSLPLIATSGIDDDIKLWSPIADQRASLSDMNTITSRNQKLLEEGDPIVIPAAIVLQLLNSSS